MGGWRGRGRGRRRGEGGGGGRRRKRNAGMRWWLHVCAQPLSQEVEVEEDVVEGQGTLSSGR